MDEFMKYVNAVLPVMLVIIMMELLLSYLD
jgi:hypothetical protein